MPYCDTPDRATTISWSCHRLVIREFSGTDKASTLVRFAQANPNCRMLYLAYNLAVNDGNEQKFPLNVECKTSNQLASPNFGRHYQRRLTANLRITGVACQLNTRYWPLARTSITTLNAFLWNGDGELSLQHLSDEDSRSGFPPDKILAVPQLLWSESARQDGTFLVTHVVYLKLRFRGTENAVDAPELADANQLYLTHCFCFGPAVARVVNMLLARQGEMVFVVGKKAYWVGGSSGYKTEELEELNWFSGDMPERMPSPLLAREYRNFETCELVARATRDVETNQGIQLFEQYLLLPQKLQEMRECAVTNESQVQVTVSTEHRSKGLECPVVMLNHDFVDITAPMLAGCERTDETNLLYVAVPEARQTLVLNELLQVLMDSESNDIAGGQAC